MRDVRNELGWLLGGGGERDESLSLFLNLCARAASSSLVTKRRSLTTFKNLQTFTKKLNKYWNRNTNSVHRVIKSSRVDSQVPSQADSGLRDVNEFLPEFGVDSRVL